MKFGMGIDPNRNTGWGQKLCEIRDGVRIFEKREPETQILKIGDRNEDTNLKSGTEKFKTGDQGR